MESSNVKYNIIHGPGLKDWARVFVHEVDILGKTWEDSTVDRMFQLHITSSQATGSDRPSQVGAAARRRVWTSHGPGVVFSKMGSELGLYENSGKTTKSSS